MTSKPTWKKALLGVALGVGLLAPGLLQGEEALPSRHEVLCPVEDATITSPYGMRGDVMHTGVDFGAALGSNVMAVDTGVVKQVHHHIDASEGGIGYGNYILLDHGDAQTLYGHLKTIDVEEGDVVLPGDVIGTVGSTGYSTGPHLHFEYIYDGCHQDPMDYVRWEP